MLEQAKMARVRRAQRLGPSGSGASGRLGRLGVRGPGGDGHQEEAQQERPEGDPIGLRELASATSDGGAARASGWPVIVIVRRSGPAGDRARGRSDAAQAGPTLAVGPAGARTTGSGAVAVSGAGPVEAPARCSAASILRSH